MAFSLQDLLPQLKRSATLTPQRVVGIDFGSASVKVVEVEGNRIAVRLLETEG